MVCALRARATFWTYRSLAAALERVPEWVADSAGWLVGQAMWAKMAPERELVGRHLSLVLGQDLEPRLRSHLVHEAFISYARYWVSSARIVSFTPQEVRERMVCVDGLENLDGALRDGLGAVLAIPHIGNWDFGGRWLFERGTPLTSVAEILEPPELFDWFVRERARVGVRALPLDASAGPELLAVLRSNGIVGLLCDRDVAGGGVEVTFFGRQTTVPGGPAAIALRTGAALLPTAVYMGPGRSFNVVIADRVRAEREGRLRDDVRRVTQEVVYALEDLIRRAPLQWHLFQPNWPDEQDCSDRS